MESIDRRPASIWKKRGAVRVTGRQAAKKEDEMSSNVNSAGNVQHVATTENTEARDTRIFFAFVLFVLVAAIVVGALFGLGGIGALAIAAAAGMLVVCMLLTSG